MNALWQTYTKQNKNKAGTDDDRDRPKKGSRSHGERQEAGKYHEWYASWYDHEFAVELHTSLGFGQFDGAKFLHHRPCGFRHEI